MSYICRFLIVILQRLQVPAELHELVLLAVHAAVPAPQPGPVLHAGLLPRPPGARPAPGQRLPDIAWCLRSLELILNTNCIRVSRVSHVSAGWLRQFNFVNYSWTVSPGAPLTWPPGCPPGTGRPGPGHSPPTVRRHRTMVSSRGGCTGEHSSCLLTL